ncbi:MAG: fumarylacetoacetate hydrolase family protein [Desulfotomaculaceae bacterium]
MGKTCRNIKESETGECIFGYTCGNDITARDLQEKDGQWTRSKSFDTFLPLGPYIAKDLNPADLAVSMRLNGEIKQSSSTRNLIFGVKKLVSFISGIMTLYPGDVIMTGTPSGIGPVVAGDRIEVEIEGIGVLANGVRSYLGRF